MEQSKTVSRVLLGACLFAVTVCLVLVGFAALSSREAVLIGVVLTIASMIGSWTASQYYAAASFSSNLTTFAYKASEKVNNLSNEIDRLIGFLQKELDTSDYQSSDEALLARDLRIEGAIHVLATLKSVNDRSLSDWKGVIGSEIDEQLEEREEREEELRDLIGRVEALYSSQATSPSDRDDLAESLRSEINAVRGDLRQLASQVGGVALRPRGSKVKQTLIMPCPECQKPVQFRQKASTRSMTAVRCSKCGAKLFSFYADGNFGLRSRQPVDESVTCPRCSSTLPVKLDPLPGSSQWTACSTCGLPLTIARASDEVRVLARSEASPSPKVTSKVPLSDDVLERVRATMPPQPWPKGAARIAAATLGLPQGIVTRAVNELIRRGAFKVQIDGKLYDRQIEN